MRTISMLAVCASLTMVACGDDDAVGNQNNAATCGNGIAEAGEVCDGADLNGQSCDSLGHAEGTLGCTTSCTFDTSGCVQPSYCGDGQQDPDEICDDGNTTSGDGCSADCLSDESCGNSYVDVAAGEACDDGNTVSGDGCQSTCALPTCGDGTVDFGEVCDDGNQISDDGCNEYCTSDESCGNGVVDGSASEQCDDGNIAPGDGCGPTCQVEYCGNSIVDPGEVCDDGNVMSGDGCSTDCQSDESCGNGLLDLSTGEQCDDGNNTDCDGCSGDCSRQDSVCGDGLLECGEECDDGNGADYDGCSSGCEIEESSNCSSDRALHTLPKFTVAGGLELGALQPPFTLEAWIQRDATNLFQGTVVSCYQQPAIGNHRLQLTMWSPSSVTFQLFGGGDQYYSVGKPDTGVLALGWYHVAVCCDTSSCTIFLDGEPGPAASLPAGPIQPFTGNWTFGANPGLAEELRVPLDEIRISSMVRYTTSFTPMRRWQPDASTLGLWHLDETTGNLVPDSSSYGNDGTVASGTWGPSECGICLDGLDQDGNGLTDCSDPSCASENVCF